MTDQINSDAQSHNKRCMVRGSTAIQLPHSASLNLLQQKSTVTLIMAWYYSSSAHKSSVGHNAH